MSNFIEYAKLSDVINDINSGFRNNIQAGVEMTLLNGLKTVHIPYRFNKYVRENMVRFDLIPLCYMNALVEEIKVAKAENGTIVFRINLREDTLPYAVFYSKKNTASYDSFLDDAINVVKKYCLNNLNTDVQILKIERGEDPTVSIYTNVSARPFVVIMNKYSRLRKKGRGYNFFDH